MSIYKGRVILSLLYAGKSEINISMMPQSAREALKLKGEDYICVLGPLFKEEIDSVSIEFSSLEWNAGASIEVWLEDVNNEWERTNEGCITKDEQMLVIKKTAQDEYEVFIKECFVQEENTNIVEIPDSLTGDDKSEIEEELLERIHSDVEIAKFYRNPEIELDVEFKKIHKEIQERTLIVDEELIKKVLQMENMLSEWIAGKNE